MDEKELQALYNAMSKTLDIGGYDQFKAKMQTTDDRKRFYDVVGQNGFDLGNYSEYENRIAGVKKKENSGVLSQGAAILSRAGGKSGVQLPSNGKASVAPQKTTSKVEEDILAGVSHSPQTEADVKRQQDFKKVMNPVGDDFDYKDPVKSVGKRILASTIRFEQPKAESTNQQSLSTENKIEVQKGQATNNADKVTPHNAAVAAKEVIENTFPSSKSARQWLFQSGKEFDPNNETDVLARNVIHNYENVKTIIGNNGLNEKAAFEYYADKDPQLKLLKAKGIMPPENVQGDLFARFLEDKNVKELANTSQEMHNAYKEQADNFWQNHPEQRTNKILAQIAQAREDYGYNNPFLNLVGVKSSDKMIENLSMRGKIDPWDKEFYYKEVRPFLELHAKKIPTTGLIENAFQSATKAIEDVPKSVYEATGLRELLTTQADRTYQNIEEDADQIGVKPKNLVNKISHATGSLAGVVLPIGGEAKLLQSFNLMKDANKANQLMMGLTFYHDLQKEAEKNNPGDPLGNHLTALVQSAIFMKINPTFQKLSGVIMKESQPAIKDIFNKLKNEEISGIQAKEAIVNTVVNKAAEVGKNSLKGASEMALATGLNDAVGGIFSGKFDVDKASQNMKHTFESMILGMPLLNIATMKGSQRNVTGDILMEISERPDYFREQITKQSELDLEFAKQAPQLLENLDHVTAIKKELDGREDMKPAQKRDFLITELQSKILQDKIKNSPSKALNTKDEKQLEELEISKKIILDPDIPNTKIVQEFYDNDLLGKGSMESLSGVDADGKPTNKFDPSKVGEYIKEVAQRTNNLDSDWKPNKVGNSSEAAKSSYPEAIVEMANKRWAKEIDNAKTKQDAIQKQESNEMDVRQQAGYGEGMGERNPETEITTREKEGEIKGKEEVVIDQVRELPDENTQTETISETASPEKKDVGDTEYNDFIDKGKVSDERLNDIANKVKNQEPLSDREKEIFTDKTGEINKIIKAQTASPVLVGGDGKVKYLDNYEVNDVEIPDGIENEPNWQEKLVDKAFKDMGLKPHKKTAGTGTIYYTFKDKNGEDIVVRLGDHSKGRWAGREVEANVVYDKDSTPRDVLDILRDKLPDGKIVKEQSLSPKEGEQVQSSKGVGDVYKSNEELKTIGSEKEYADYLKTIFPDTQVKDILYHRSNEKFDQFDNSKKNNETGGLFDFSKTDGNKQYGKNVYPVLLNVKKLGEGFVGKESDGFYNEVMGGEKIYSVPNANQIHILGSKSDIEGFKKWKQSQAQSSKVGRGEGGVGVVDVELPNYGKTVDSKMGKVDLVIEPNTESENKNSIKVSAYDADGNTLGFSSAVVDAKNKTLTVKVSQIKDKYQRNGIYSKIIDEYETIAKDKGLKLERDVEGETQASKDFWSNRQQSLSSQPLTEVEGGQSSGVGGDVKSVLQDEYDNDVYWHGSDKEIKGQPKVGRSDSIIKTKMGGIPFKDLWDAFYVTKEKGWAEFFSPKRKEVHGVQLKKNVNILDLTDVAAESTHLKNKAFLGGQNIKSDFPFQKDFDAYAFDWLNKQREKNGKPPLTKEEFKSKDLENSFRPTHKNWFLDDLGSQAFADYAKEKGYDAVKFGREIAILNPDVAKFVAKEQSLSKQESGGKATENETKQEPTKDIKPEQAESQPQPEKTIVEDKQGAGKTKQQEIADKVRALKVNLSKLSGGGLQSNPLGLPVAVWNGAMDIVAKTIEVTGNVADAIQKGIKYIQKNHRGQWDKKGFNDQVLKELGVRGITVNGEDLIVKNDAKTEREYAKTVNGWYSDLEQSVLDVKGEQGRGENWIKVLGKSDEAKWTGLNDWLSQQKGKVSKADIQQYLRDNRIEIVEVVKGAVDYNAKNNNLSYTGSDDFVFLKDNGRNTNYEIRKKKAGFYDVYDNGENIGSRPTLDEAKELAEANFNAENGNPQIDKSASVKFDGYQLAGEKENYKEVLVTMPSATKVEMPKPIETYTGSGKYKLVFDNGNQLSGTYTKEEVADVLKRRSEDKTGMYIDRNEQFKSSHFEEPNILVHLRMNTRVDAEGKKVLFLEEVQSDWGQQGKKSGFANTEQISKLRDEETKLRDSVKKNKGKITADTPDDVYNKIRNENKLLEEQIYAIQTKITDLQSKSTPSAPFVTDTNAWTKLALKVALKEAVKQGAEKIGWTTGEQQNDRYDLSKQVDKIDVEKVEEVPNLFFVDIRLPDGTKYMLEIENGVVRSDSKYEGQRLEDIVGKDIAEKILNGGTQTLQGDGLKIGGKGMKGFYGSPTEKSLGIVGNVAKSLFKQEPKTIEIENSNIKKSSIGTGKLFTKNAVENAFTRGMVVKDYNGNILTKEEAIRLAENANSLDDKEYAYATNKESTSTQHSIDITPELKAEVEGGLPLFKDIKGRGKEIADLLRKGKIKLGGLQSNIAGLPIAVYNGAIEVIARALEGGATLTQAINRAYQKLKIKEKHKNFNQDEFIKKLEEATGEKFEDSEGAKESGEKINLTHAGTEEIYKEGGLPLRLETPTKHREQLEKEADEILQKGYDFDKVADETLSGNRKWEDTDQVLFERKVADLKAKQKGLDVLSPEFDKLQTQIEKYSRASDIAGTLGGRLLQSRKAGRDVEETISDYLIVEKELNQDAPLTDKQKETVQKEFTDIQKAQADYNQKIAELQAENARLKAEAEVKKAKATSKKGVKKDYAAERKEIFESIKEKLKKARQDTSATILPYAKELIAIAPEIGKLVKNLVDNGVDKLADIVKEIHSGLKEDIEGITEKDVRDLIAGEYNPKKPTRTELATKLFDLKRQAQLTNKLEALLRGEEPKNEQKKIRRNQGIENLKSQIKEFEKAKKDAEKEPVEKKTPDEIALQAIKTRTQKELDKINEQLRTGDFSKPEKKEATKLDREAIELKDKLIKARQEREIRILKQEYANRSKYEKAKQNALEVLNVPRTIMSSMDYSAPLRQGLWAGISHPRTMGLAGIEMFKQSLSQKRFDRWFHDLRETPRYETMEKSGLYVADPHDPRLSAKEEAFMNNLAEKIPFLGKLIKGSERAYVGFLNKMRVDLFNRFADRYEEQGRTVENSPELYKSMADYINNSTGRGKLGPLENYAPLFNTAFFSPRLMASRINLLTMPFTPKFYSKEVPKQIRIMYAKDLFKFLALGTSVLALAKLNGAQVEDDPRSSDFGKIHDKNTRWDVWGGFQPYVRLAAQMVTGEKKSTNSGEIQNLNGEGRFGTNRMDVFGQFLRGKLSPVPGMAVDFVKGKDAVGNDVTIGGEAESHLLPLLYSDLKEAIKDRGVSALFTVGVPSIFGVGTNTYSPRPPAKPRKQTTGKPQGPKKEKM